MASRALIARLRMIISVWVGSVSACHRLWSRSRRTEMLPPKVRRSNSSRPPKVRLRFSGTGSRRWRREKASSCEVSLAPRSPASRICVRRLRAFSRSPLSRSRSRKLEPVRMTVSRLLKSWATPAVSWPTASSRCICCNAASMRSRSVICSRRRSLASARPMAASRSLVMSRATT
ncbi:hypothetical protein D3C79_562750 [compost metagenome]